MGSSVLTARLATVRSLSASKHGEHRTHPRSVEFSTIFFFSGSQLIDPSRQLH